MILFQSTISSQLAYNWSPTPAHFAPLTIWHHKVKSWIFERLRIGNTKGPFPVFLWSYYNQCISPEFQVSLSECLVRSSLILLELCKVWVLCRNPFLALCVRKQHSAMYKRNPSLLKGLRIEVSKVWWMWMWPNVLSPLCFVTLPAAGVSSVLPCKGWWLFFGRGEANKYFWKMVLL